MKMSHYFLFGCISFIFFSFSVCAENLTQIDRYSTVENKPTLAQINPLFAIAEFHFPASIKTVGEAIQMVLDNTGYELAVADHLSVWVKEVTAKPLPITNRQLGPLTIKDMLTVLMGNDVFNLLVDPLHRKINFEMKPSIAKALGVNNGRSSKKYDS
jgi:conjugative transfer region protein (TIGR03748 family)